MFRRLGELSRSRIAEAEPGDCEESAAGAVRLSQLLPASRRALVLQSLENLCGKVPNIWVIYARSQYPLLN